ncbi:MAG: hypothetical protein AAF387_19640, partial [Pseudomonadota bacterium]
MRELFQLVGETAAQSIWSVSVGDALTPLLTTLNKDGDANYMRLAMDDSAEAVRYGHDKLNRVDEEKIGAVFVADGLVSLESGKTDALVVDVRIYADSVVKCQMVIPYRSAKSPKGFAVHRPQITELENIDRIKFQPLLEAFFAGVESHQQGGKIWQQYYIDDIDTEYAGDIDTPYDSVEWQAMLEAPFLVYLSIAPTDEELSETAVSGFRQALATSSKYQSNLLHRLCTNAFTQFDEILSRLEHHQGDLDTQLQNAVAIVERSFSSEETKAFKLGLIAMAHDICETADGQRKNFASVSD